MKLIAGKFREREKSAWSGWMLFPLFLSLSRFSHQGVRAAAAGDENSLIRPQREKTLEPERERACFAKNGHVFKGICSESIFLWDKWALSLRADYTSRNLMKKSLIHPRRMAAKKFEKLIQRRQAAAEKLVLVHSLSPPLSLSLAAFYQFQLLSIFLGMPMHE
jgi:hypothetical protein